MIKQPLHWVATALLILILTGVSMAQDHHPDADINVISREIDPDIDLNEIGKQIANHPAYERAAKIAKEIEDDLNRRVQKMVVEKKETIDAVNRQIIEQTIGSKPTEKSKEDLLFDEKARIFIFVSRSVPLDALQSYAAAIESLGSHNTRLAFLAFPENFLNSILKKDPDCTADDCVVKAKITIGPKLFKQYGIQQVPAVVYDPDPDDEASDQWLKVSGAVPLEKILNLFYQENQKEVLQIAAQRAAKKYSLKDRQ